MRGPFGPSGQRTWPGIMEREAGDPWGTRGQESPSVRRARARQRGEYLSGVETTMHQNDGDDELLAAELEDDVVGSGIFDEPGRRPTANPDMGVLASNFGLPGYLARERPFEVSEDIISASGARFVPVPAGGMSYVSPASVGPAMLLEEDGYGAGARRTYRRDATLPKASIVEPLGEDAIATHPRRAMANSPYYVEDGCVSLSAMGDGKAEINRGQGQGRGRSGHTPEEWHNKGRQVAAALAKGNGLGVGKGQSPHPVWGQTRTPGEKPPWAGPKGEKPQLPGGESTPWSPSRVSNPLSPLVRRPSPAPYTQQRTEPMVYGPTLLQRQQAMVRRPTAPTAPSNVSMSGAFYLRPGAKPVRVGVRGLGVEESSAPMGLGGWLVTGLVLGIAGSILYETVK